MNKTDEQMRSLVREMEDAVRQRQCEADGAKRKERDLVRRTLAELSDAELAALIRVTTNVYDLHCPIRYPGEEARAEAVGRFLSRNK